MPQRGQHHPPSRSASLSPTPVHASGLTPRRPPRRSTRSPGCLRRLHEAARGIGAGHRRCSDRAASGSGPSAPADRPRGPWRPWQGLREQAGGAAGCVVRGPAGVAAVMKSTYTRWVLSATACGGVADQGAELLAGGGVERERDLRGVAGAEPVVVGRPRMVEPVHPGGPRGPVGPVGPAAAARASATRIAGTPEEPVGDHRGQEVARAGARPVGPVDVQAGPDRP